jgi:hypothetical protein
VEQPGRAPRLAPASPGASPCGQAPSIARLPMAEKFQRGARKIPASCQDWCDRQC